MPMQSEILHRIANCTAKNGFCGAICDAILYVGSSNKTLKGDFYLKSIRDRMIGKLVKRAAAILHERDAVNDATNAASYPIISYELTATTKQSNTITIILATAFCR